MLGFMLSSAVASELSVSTSSGGLKGAVQTLQARHGVAIDLEEPIPTQGIDTVRVRIGSRETWWPSIEGFRFNYSGGAEEGLRAMVAAWDAAGGSGDYRVDVVNGVYHLVPTSGHDSAGRDVPWTPVLNCTIELSITSGTPLELWNSAAEAISSQCLGGTPVAVLGGARPPDEADPLQRPDMSQFIRPDPEHPGQTFEDLDAMMAITLAETLASRPPPALSLPGRRDAREVLDAIARAASDGGWIFAWEKGCWTLFAAPIDPAQEYLFNDTPIFGGPPRPRSKSPVRVRD